MMRMREREEEEEHPAPERGGGIVHSDHGMMGARPRSGGFG